MKPNDNRRYAKSCLNLLDDMLYSLYGIDDIYSYNKRNLFLHIFWYSIDESRFNEREKSIKAKMLDRWRKIEHGKEYYFSIKGYDTDSIQWKGFAAYKGRLHHHIPAKTKYLR